jgi:hypothetical protein
MPERKTVPQEKSTNIWKTHKFRGEFGTDKPTGHSRSSGPCFREALLKGGIDTDLPFWIDGEHLPEICERLGLDLVTGKGGSASVARGEPYIVGYVTSEHALDMASGRQKRMGHFRFTTDIVELLIQKAGYEIFAIISIPRQK